MAIPLLRALIRADSPSVGEVTGVVDVRRRPVLGQQICYSGSHCRRAWGAATLLGLWIVLASSVATAPQAAAGPAPAPQVKAQPVAVSDARLERSALAIDEGKFADAFGLVGEALAEGKLSDTDSDWASYLKARALAGLGKADDAQAAAEERFKLNPNGYTWASLVAILTTVNRHDAAAAAILDLEEEQFIWANRLRPAVIENIVASLPEKSPARDRLIVRLVEGRYSGPQAQRVPDTLRLRYISMLVRQNKIENAAQQTIGVETPMVLGILLSDRAFEPLWEHPKIKALTAPGALIARVERGVQAQLEQPTLSSSDWLDIMRTYRIIGRADEAVRLGLHALDQAREEKRAAGAALRLEMARAYAAKGEPWAAKRAARELLREEQSLSVPLRVSIAQVLDDAGDDDGALVLLSALKGADRTAAVLRLTACAAHDLGRIAVRDAALAQLEALGDAALGDRFEALVRTGATAKAADVLAKMFAEPELRTSAILMAQLYAGPSKWSADPGDMHYRMTALVASDAAQAAIKPHARSIGLPFTFASALLER